MHEKAMCNFHIKKININISLPVFDVLYSSSLMMMFHPFGHSGTVFFSLLFISFSLCRFPLTRSPVYCGPHPTQLRPFPRRIPPTYAHSHSHILTHTVENRDTQQLIHKMHTTYLHYLYTHSSLNTHPLFRTHGVYTASPTPPLSLSVWNTLRRPVACERWLGLGEEKHNYFSPRLFTQRWQKLVWSMKSQKFLPCRGRQIGINLHSCARVCLQSFHLCSFPIS